MLILLLVFVYSVGTDTRTIPYLFIISPLGRRNPRASPLLQHLTIKQLKDVSAWEMSRFHHFGRNEAYLLLFDQAARA